MYVYFLNCILQCSYQCHDTAKKVVNVELDNSPLYDILEVECLYNGQWSPVITDWSCTGTPKNQCNEYILTFVF